MSGAIFEANMTNDDKRFGAIEEKKQCQPTPAFELRKYIANM